jgi:hypothetical protein
VAETAGWRAKKGEDERNGGKAGKKGQEAPLREACLSEKREGRRQLRQLRQLRQW